MPLYILRQDITAMACDAIVNPTNEELVGYGGVDLAIHTKAGPGLAAECARLAPLEMGFAKVTGGHGLPCKHIIHTFGPLWQGGDRGERALLRSCYWECLRQAVALGCETVAFPLISSGEYGYPKERVLRDAVGTVAEFLREHELTVFLCVWDAASYAFSRLLFEDISAFLAANLALEEPPLPCAALEEPPSPCAALEELAPAPRRRASPRRLAEARRLAEEMPQAPLSAFLQGLEDGFAETLLAFIDARGMTDAECYKKANVDKKTFSKIKCNTIKTPKKRTAVAFAIALELSLEDTRRLLGAAGMTLSRSSKFDMIIEYFIRRGEYDIFRINEALFEFDQELLGSL